MLSSSLFLILASLAGGSPAAGAHASEPTDATHHFSCTPGRAQQNTASLFEMSAVEDDPDDSKRLTREPSVDGVLWPVEDGETAVRCLEGCPLECWVEARRFEISPGMPRGPPSRG